MCARSTGVAARVGAQVAEGAATGEVARARSIVEVFEPGAMTDSLHVRRARHLLARLRSRR